MPSRVSSWAQIERIEGPAPTEDSSVPPDPIAASPQQPLHAGHTAVPARRTIDLPAPHGHGLHSLEEALGRRRSVRSFAGAPVTLEELSQLLWAAQGISAPPDARTSPSAGATYPLELFACTHVGCHHYRPDGHRLDLHTDRDIRPSLASAAHDQAAVREAAVVIVITAVLASIRARYGERASRYVAIEAGHAAQNTLLQAVALGLGAVPIGSFDDDDLQRALGADPSHETLYLVAVGRPALPAFRAQPTQ